MKKIYVLLLCSLCMGALDVNAVVINDLEEIYLESEGGYSEVNTAVEESEEFFDKKIALPTRLPSIAFTHNFGRFSNFSIPKLEITYLDEKSGYTHYGIDIIPNEYKMTLPKDAKTVSLADGSEAFYYSRRNFTMFVLEKNEFQYTFTMDKESAEKISIEGMVKIANSMR